MWSDWLSKFSSILDIHGPFSNKDSHAKNLLGLIPNDLVWLQFKNARNEVNNLVKKSGIISSRRLIEPNVIPGTPGDLLMS